MAEAVYLLIKRTLAGLPKAYLDGIEYDEDYASRRWAIDAWRRMCRMLVLKSLDLAGNEGLRARFVSAAIAVRKRLRFWSWRSAPRARMFSTQSEHSRVAAMLEFPPPPDAKLKGWMYAQLALRYEARQRNKDALDLWQQAAVLNGIVERSSLQGGDLPPVGYTHVAN